ncbi:hypothetical protein BC629DRAFT_787299 [Irpex lacteus]|nr:hypothetical protein BC629DRAFT_787299 [Irpex lacteus]
MSSITQLQQEFIGSYIDTSANVVLLFESIITLSQEVDGIWCQKWNLMTWLYACMRYSAVANNILLLTPPWSFEHADDQRGRRFRSLHIVAGGIGKPWIYVLSLIARIATIVGDMLVITATWIKTAQLHNGTRRIQLINAPLVTIILRDGTIYFIVLLVINILNIIERNTPALFHVDLIESLVQVLPSIVVCRFILNLRQVKRPEVPSVSGNHTPGSSSYFLSNLGQPLQLGEDEEDGGEPEVLGLPRFSQADGFA